MRPSAHASRASGLWLAGLALVLSGVAHAAAPVIGAPAALERVRSGEALLIDVRTPQEWAQTGVPEGALTIDLQDPAFFTKVAEAAARDPAQPLLLICRTGRRSAVAADHLLRAGFRDVSNVGEGMAGRSGAGPGWLKRGLPTQPYPTPSPSAEDAP